MKKTTRGAILCMNNVGHPPLKRLSVLLFVLLFGFPQSARSGVSSASSQESKDRPSLHHQAAATLKLIQVIVTDKRGNPITDLGKEDFIVSDNGEEKKITEFEKHSLSLPASDASAVERREISLRPSATLLGRKLLFLFDTVFVDGKGFRAAREATLRFIRKDLLPEDEVAVIFFTGGSSLRIGRFLSRDHAAALSAIGAPSPGDLMKRIGGTDTRDEGEIEGTTITMDGETTVKGSPDSSPGRILAANFIWALRSLAQTLRFVPGKKSLILYSNGIQGAFIGRGESGAGGNTDLSRDFEKMCKELATANISVYPVNTASTKIGFVKIDDADWKEGKTGVPSLRDMAAETGGRYLGRADNAAVHMDRINTLTGTYYVIGYPIRETWDGKFHTLRVKVKRPGAEVSAQPGYFNPKPFSRYAELEKKIDLIDLALSDKPMSQEPVRFAMQAWPGAVAPPDNLHAIAEVQSAGLGEVAGRRVEFVSILFDGLDQIVDLRRAELNLTPAALGTARAFLFASLSGAPGTYKCRIVLRNLETGRAAVAGTTMAVPGPEPGQVAISPPLFLASGGGAPYLDGNAGKNGRENRSSPEARITASLLFDPAKYSPRPEGSFPSHSPIFVLAQCVSASGNESRLELAASLTDESAGTESPLPLTVLAEKEAKGAKTFFARIDIPEIEWGAYILALVVKDGASGLSARVTKVISIE